MAVENPPAPPQYDHLLIRVDDEVVAVPAAVVTRVVNSRAVFPMPGVAEACAGLTRLGGEPVVALSLSSLMSGRPARWVPRGPIVFLTVAEDSHHTTLGLVVSEALDVVRIPPSAWDRREAGEGPFNETARLEDGRTVVRLDVGSLGAGARPATKEG